MIAAAGPAAPAAPTPGGAFERARLPRRVLVTGGSGFVGRALCEALVACALERAEPVTIVVPTRRLRHARAVQPLPMVELHEADVHDEAALSRLVAGVDAVVHLVAVLHGTEATFRAVHAALPQKLAAACRAAGVRRVVHVSALGVARDAPSRYLRSKAEGEAALLGAGLDVTVLRPSVIFGAQDRFTNLFVQLQRLAPAMPLAGADARFQPVWVNDVAAAIVAAIERPVATAGRVFECAGPEVMTLADIVRTCGRLAGVERPIVPLPAAIGRLQAFAMECLPGEPLMSRDNVDSMRVPNVASGTLPGLAELGIRPAALQATAAAWLAPSAGRARYDDMRSRVRRG
jgi:NADH dehydrogenase